MALSHCICFLPIITYTALTDLSHTLSTTFPTAAAAAAAAQTPANTSSHAAALSKDDSPPSSASPDAKRTSSRPVHTSSPSTYGVSGTGITSEPKLAPLRELKGLSSKPLPSIGGGGGSSSGAQASALLGEKKRATEEALRRGQEQLAEQRKREEALRSKVRK